MSYNGCMGRSPKGEQGKPQKALTVKLDQETYDGLNRHLESLNSEIERLREKQDKERQKMSHEELRKKGKKHFYKESVQSFVENLIKKSIG